MSSMMPAMGATSPHGELAMSMMWSRMPGQSWLGAATSFVAMWSVMMFAMMLPSLVPVLRRYRRSLVPVASPRAVTLTAIVAIAYMTVWAAVGAVIYPPGAMLASLATTLPTVARSIRVSAGLVVLASGALQLTPWKRVRLDCWRTAMECAHHRSANARGAWHHGVQLGAECVRCGAGLTASLLALGAMDPKVMVVLTVAGAVERLAPNADRVARLVGVAGVVAGAVMIARAVG